MHPDDISLCGFCGLDEITHDHTVDHAFNAVGGGSHPPPVQRSKLRRNGLRIVVYAGALWLAALLCIHYL